MENSRGASPLQKVRGHFKNKEATCTLGASQRPGQSSAVGSLKPCPCSFYELSTTFACSHLLSVIPKKSLVTKAKELVRGENRNVRLSLPWKDVPAFQQLSQHREVKSAPHPKIHGGRHLAFGHGNTRMPPLPALQT